MPVEPTGNLETPDAAPDVASVTLSLRQPGMLVADIRFASPVHAPPAFTVHVDGQAWATLPSQFSGAQRASVTLTCSLPPHLSHTEVEILLARPETGLPVGRGRLRIGASATNAHGLAARDVFDPAIAPMFSVPWMQFDGAEIVVSGAHLPPYGDPSRLSVSVAEGVDADFDYPLSSPEFGAHYWYWPNAHHAGFRLRIKLAASRFGADPFSFRFDIDGAGDTSKWADRARVWLPADLRDFVGFPTDGDQLTRVQTWSDHKTVTLTGYSAFRGFESLLAHHGVAYQPGIQVLDWGCGHGRVTRHFLRHWPAAKIFGTDIDGGNIAWCQANLSRTAFVHAPLWPPVSLPPRSFDAIIGLSVMTHLSANGQKAWLKEIHRMLKPGGIALISFGGDGAAAFASIHHGPDWWRAWREAGFDDSVKDTALGDAIADPEYYRVTHQSADHVLANWSGRLTVEAVERQAFGYQDIAVLRKTA